MITQTEANLARALKRMLEVYWADGDGDDAPEFIREAQALVEHVEREHFLYREARATGVTVARLRRSQATA
jgi:hypothetical protein